MTTDLVAPTRGTGKRVTANGISIYYEEQGEGDPVLLLHGGIMDHQSWGNQLPALAEHFRVLAPDTRAHGRSSDPDGPLGYRLFAADSLGFLAELGIPRAHIVGFSDGGSTGLLLAMDHPEVVDKLVLIGTSYNTSNYPEGTVDHFPTLTPEMLYGAVGPEFGEVMRKAEAVYPDRESWLAFWRKLVNDLWSREPDLRLEDLRAIKAPTLILHAENEQFYGKEHSEDMARVIPNALLEFVPKASHTSPQENPSAVNAAILRFLSRN